MTPIILASFFLSGAACLIYELTWSRQVVHLLGNSLFSVTTVVSMVMAGLAAGSYWAGNCSQIHARPLKTFSLLQASTAILSSLCTVLFRQDFLTANYLVVSIAVFCPNFLMGAAWPVLSGYLNKQAGNPMAAAAYLYAANTFGALTGTICSGFLLLPAWGLTTSCLVAAALNCIASIIAALFPAARCSPDTPPAENVKPAAAGLNNPRLPALAFAGGFIIMLLEIIWIRFFALVLGSTTYSLSIVLSCFLCGQTLGAFISANLFKIRWSPRLCLSLVSLLAAAAIYAGLCFYNQLPAVLLSWQETLWAPGKLETFHAALSARAAVAGIIMLAPATLLGCWFPLTLQISQLPAASSVGRLYAASNWGAVTGTWLGGFVLLPGLSQIFDSGIQAGLITICVILLWLSGSLSMATGSRQVLCHTAFWNLSLLGLLVLALSHPPGWNKLLLTSGISFMEASGNRQLEYLQKLESAPPTTLLFYREGLNTTVSVEANRQQNIVLLKNDGKVEASVPQDPALPHQSSLSTQVLLGELPWLLHSGKARQAFVIGYGSGTTCGSLLNSDLQEITVAELEPAVFLADCFFQPANNRPLSAQPSGRLKLHTFDGRSYLAQHSNKFDIIVCQPSDPCLNGASDVFTYEFWRLGRRRLNSQGIFCQWLQLYAITPEYLQLLCRTFVKVFPQTLIIHPPGAGEVLLLGKVEPWRLEPKRILERLYQPPVRKDLLRINVESLDDLRSMIISSPGEIKAFAAHATAARINTDDNLLTEFALPRKLWQQHHRPQANLLLLAHKSTTLNSLLPGSTLAPEPIRQARQHQAQAKVYAAGGQLHQALEQLEQALKLDRLSPDIMEQTAAIHQHLGNYRQAEDYLREALALAPNNFARRFALGKLLCRRQQSAQGLLEIQRASRLEPHNPQPYLYVTCWFIGQQNWTLARQNLNRYRLAVPHDPQAALLSTFISRQAVRSEGQNSYTNCPINISEVLND